MVSAGSPPRPAWIESTVRNAPAGAGAEPHGASVVAFFPKKNLSAPCYKMALKDFKRPHHHHF